MQMIQVIGTKIINAMPMNRAEYNNFRGWDLPDDEDGNDEGYLVEYPGGGKNTDPFEGYVSWSPKEQFEDAYRETSGMNFGLAIEALKKGCKVARAGWNGKDMFLVFIKGHDTISLTPGTPYAKANVGRVADINSHIDMFTAQGTFQPGWLASQTDMLADDWCIID